MAARCQAVSSSYRQSPSIVLSLPPDLNFWQPLIVSCSLHHHNTTKSIRQTVTSLTHTSMNSKLVEEWQVNEVRSDAVRRTSVLHILCTIFTPTVGVYTAYSVNTFQHINASVSAKLLLPHHHPHGPHSCRSPCLHNIHDKAP